jgi:hypothetical protein
MREGRLGKNQSGDSKGDLLQHGIPPKIRAEHSDPPSA